VSLELREGRVIRVVQFQDAHRVGGQVLDPAAALATYVDVFNTIGWGAVGLGVLLGVASFWLGKLAHKDVLDASAGGRAKPVPAE